MLRVQFLFQTPTFNVMSKAKKKVPKPTRAPKRPLDYLDTVLRVGSDAADLIAEISHNLTPLGATSVGLRVLERYREYSQKGLFDWLETNNKKYASTWGYDSYSYRVCALKSQPCVVSEVKDDSFVETEIDGIKYYWILDDDEGTSVEGPFVDEEIEVSLVRARMGQYMWENISSNKAVLVNEGDSLFIDAEIPKQILSSKTSEEILDRSKKFIDKNINRSIVLLGEPGTGKSTMMRYIAESIGGFSLRIAAADLKSLSPSKILGAVRLLAPKCLLIDDFDRIQGHDTLLSELEELNETVKLFMVSVNDIENIPQAVLRPGRFDELHTIKGIDREIVDRLIGDGVAEDIKRALVTMPIAYVVEFSKRRDVLGPEGAVDEARELLHRSNKIWQFQAMMLRKKKRSRSLRPKRSPLYQLRKAEKRVERAKKSIVQTEKYNEKTIERTNKELEKAERALEKKKEMYEKHLKQEEEKKAAKKKSTKKSASKRKPAKKSLSTKKTTKKKAAKKKATKR